MRAREFITEGRENYNGINILFQKDDEEVFVKASAGSRELGHVLFVIDGEYLIPQDLEVDERYRGQGIAQTMYDFVKSKGYKIRRSGNQTADGSKFWDKNRPEQNVWEDELDSSRTEDFAGLKMRIRQDPYELVLSALDGDWGAKELGYVVMRKGDGNEIEADDLMVFDKYRGQGIAKAMYDYLKSKGYKILKSPDVTQISDQGKESGEHFWAKNRGEETVWEELNEVNIDTDYNSEELTVKQKFIDYFVDKGYDMIGEGRDQIAFLSPRNTVLKVLGLGDTARQQAVEHYVEFFERNQRNPYYPRIYNSQRFTFDGDSYFLYETEYLNYVSNEDDTLDWLEHYLNLLGTDPVAAQEWIETNGVPDDIGEDQLYGLTQSTEDIIEYLAGPNGYMMDLSNIENIRRRGDGHLVIVDPISI